MAKNYSHFIIDSNCASQGHPLNKNLPTGVVIRIPKHFQDCNDPLTLQEIQQRSPGMAGLRATGRYYRNSYDVIMFNCMTFVTGKCDKIVGVDKVCFFRNLN